MQDLADEFAENGLDDVAEHLREHGVAETREWIDGRIAEAREEDRRYHHGEGFELHNLEVARDRLAPPLVACGICGCYHPEGFTGDCRDDANRYATAGEVKS